MTPAVLQQYLEQRFSPWIRDLGLHIVHANAEQLRLQLPATAQLSDASGHLSPQSFSAAADVAMTLLLVQALGPDHQPLRCIGFNLNLIDAANDGDLFIDAKLLRRGRSVAFGEISIVNNKDEPVAHIQSTYALQ